MAFFLSFFKKPKLVNLNNSPPTNTSIMDDVPVQTPPVDYLMNDPEGGSPSPITNNLISTSADSNYVLGTPTVQVAEISAPPQSSPCRPVESMDLISNEPMNELQNGAETPLAPDAQDWATVACPYVVTNYVFNVPVISFNKDEAANHAKALKIHPENSNSKDTRTSAPVSKQLNPSICNCNSEMAKNIVDSQIVDMFDGFVKDLDKLKQVQGYACTGALPKTRSLKRARTDHDDDEDEDDEDDDLHDENLKAMVKAFRKRCRSSQRSNGGSRVEAQLADWKDICTCAYTQGLQEGGSKVSSGKRAKYERDVKKSDEKNYIERRREMEEREARKQKLRDSMHRR